MTLISFWLGAVDAACTPRKEEMWSISFSCFSTRPSTSSDLLIKRKYHDGIKGKKKQQGFPQTVFFWEKNSNNDGKCYNIQVELHRHIPRTSSCSSSTHISHPVQPLHVTGDIIVVDHRVSRLFSNCNSLVFTGDAKREDGRQQQKQLRKQESSENVGKAKM